MPCPQSSKGWSFCLRAGLLFDYAECLLTLFLLSRYQVGQQLPSLAPLLGVATTVKFLGLGCAGPATIALLLRLAVKRLGSSGS